MALPNKVVEQLGRAPVRTPGWSGRVLMFSATFLIISLATYLGIRFGLQPYTTSRVEALNAQVAEFARQVPLEQQLEIAALYSQVVNLSTLLDQQVSQLDLLEWLEDNTNVNVQLNGVSLDRGKRTLSLNGTARSLENLGEQINIFLARRGDVQTAVLTGIIPPNTRSGPWGFQLNVVLTPQIYSRLRNPVSNVTPTAPEVEEEDASTTEEDNLDNETDEEGSSSATEEEELST